MGKIIYKIDKEDINTSKIGYNFMINCTDGIDIVFTREALDELINDYKALDKGVDEEIKTLDIQLPKSTSNNIVVTTIEDNVFIADFSVEADGSDVLRFPLPEGKWDIHKIHNNNYTLILK